MLVALNLFFKDTVVFFSFLILKGLLNIFVKIGELFDVFLEDSRL
jgi:hypothetical protein